MVAAAEVDPDDRDVCWCWTGSFQRPRIRHRPYTHEGEHEVFRHTSGCSVRERGTPMIHSPELGYAIAAHRHLYAIWTEAPVATVPRLQRCHDDRCVRPSHARELEPVPERARGRTLAGMPLGEVEDIPPLAKDVWGALMQHQPSDQLAREEAAEEIGMLIPQATWQRYLAWCAAQPENN